MQTNIELAGANGRAIRLPVAAPRERVTVATERPERPATLFAVMNEVKRAERWETMVWIGIAIAAAVLLVMSLANSVGRASPRAERIERIERIEQAPTRQRLAGRSPHRQGRSL